MKKQPNWNLIRLGAAMVVTVLTFFNWFPQPFGLVLWQFLMIYGFHHTKVGQLTYRLYVAVALSYLSTVTFFPMLHDLMEIQMWALFLIVLVHSLWEFLYIRKHVWKNEKTA